MILKFKDNIRVKAPEILGFADISLLAANVIF
jgi:hypothetical protein